MGNQVVFCPECGRKCESGFASNVIACLQCRRPVYLVRNPRDPSDIYPALGSSDEIDVPDDLGSCKIIDQSPRNEPPRNMIIETGKGTTCILIHCNGPLHQTRKSLGKPAHALNRDVLSVRLPAWLMNEIREDWESESNS